MRRELRKKDITRIKPYFRAFDHKSWENVQRRGPWIISRRVLTKVLPRKYQWISRPPKSRLAEPAIFGAGNTGPASQEAYIVPGV
jgi:hypothetical protein